MRMPAPHLLLHGLHHVFGAKETSLLAQHDLEGKVEQQIAQLVSHSPGIALAQGMIQLENLFDEVGPKRLRCLRSIPRASLPEIAHQDDRPSKRRWFLHLHLRAGYNTRPPVNASTELITERAWVEVDLATLVRNAVTARTAARGARLLPMVKADAYGLGAVPVALALESLEPWGYGVATVGEGAQLRAAGIRRPIVVFTPARAELEPAYRSHGLTAVLDDPGTAQRWTLPFHLEIDTGMGRAGVRWDAAERLAAMTSPYLEGAFTHFHSADTDPASVRRQWERFRQALSLLPRRPALVHAANSAGIFRLEERLDLVRPGVFLYGGSAGGDLPAPEPVIALRARVVSLRRLAAGDSVSYGAEWKAPAPTTIATLAVGYADGIPRAVQGRAHVLLGGCRRPVVGRVTMDMLMVDLGPSPDGVRVGDVATLIGRDGGEEITLDEFAGWAGTISYEILTGLGPRLPRRYRGAGREATEA